MNHFAIAMFSYQSDEAKYRPDGKHHVNKLHVYLVRQPVHQLNTDNGNRKSDAVNNGK